MPRGFDSDDVDGPLMFFENVQCPHCSLVFESEFYDDSWEVEDIVDQPVGSHRCPRCGHDWISEATGWTLYTEAGG